ncbi:MULTISPECIES: thioredoxin family protein [Shimia]|uniref:thioredoxin family protein n=1 Tax=Shimia TaxID=573139 RepID=UPI001FB51F7E|nr:MULTISPECIES: thioredoxin family protein [Shimia]MDV4143765.1 thioredoxin family protein [Shimia sp. FJ5]
MTLRSVLLSVALLFGSLLPAWAVELVIVEQKGCYTCRLWNEEIAPIYPKTEAGQFAPLRREDLRKAPDDLRYARAINYTPTFLLIDEGREVARLEGYPGEDFFWWHIEKMLADNTAFEGSTR